MVQLTYRKKDRGNEMIQATVKHVGENAIDPQERMLILFGAEATDQLKKVSVIQEIAENQAAIHLNLGDTISFDEQVYTITHTGQLAQEQLNAIGHATIIFQEVPEEDSLANGIYVKPFEMPIISEGTLISYQS